MTQLDRYRLGRVSMKPPVSKRYMTVSRYEMSKQYREREVKHISSMRDETRDLVKRQHYNTPCDWCERVGHNPAGEIYPYSPERHGFGWHEDLVWCCCWPCFHQWLVYHMKVTDQLDLWFALGVWPEYVPSWYLSDEIRETLAQAARNKLAVKEAQRDHYLHSLSRKHPKNHKRTRV